MGTMLIYSDQSDGTTDWKRLSAGDISLSMAGLESALGVSLHYTLFFITILRRLHVNICLMQRTLHFRRLHMQSCVSYRCSHPFKHLRHWRLTFTLKETASLSIRAPQTR
jgi:hypothetical protein